MRKSAAPRAMARAETRDRSSVRIWVVSFAFLFLAMLLATSAFAQTFRFSDIRVEGNNRVQYGTVLAHSGLGENESFSAAQLNDAYQALVATGLFESVDFAPSGSRLTITVVERPTIFRIAWEGNRRINNNTLDGLTLSQEGRVFNPVQVEKDEAAITKAYREKGMVAATVTPKIIRRSDNRVDLVFEIAEGGRTEIERVSFVGNSVFSDQRLRRILETKQAGIFRALVARDTFVADRIAFDRQVLTDFYQSRGYVDFRVLDVEPELTRNRDGYFLTFTVEEGQRFLFGDVTVQSDYPAVSADDYAKILRIGTGDVYSPTDIDNEIARLEIKATEDELDFLRVNPVITRNPENLTLDLNFVLERGPRLFVERIDIEGNATTLDKVIRRQFDQEGAVERSPFNPRELREAAARIRSLGFFSQVDVNARPGSTSDQRIVDVDVVEQATGSVTFGGNYNTATGISAIGSYSEANLLGRGQELELSYARGENNNRLTIDFAEPAFQGRDVRLGLTTGYYDTDNENALYDTSVAQFTPSLGFRLADETRLNLRYRLAAENLTDVTSTSPILLAEEAQGELVTSSLGYTLTFDNRRSGLNPDAGVVLRLGQDFAGLGGDTSYLKTAARATAQTTVADDRIKLIATLEGGVLSYLTGNSRVTDRYFMDTSVMRGFAPHGIGPRDSTSGDALGGNKFAVARLEANFPIGLPEEYGITGGLFYDAGSLWDVGAGGGVDYDDFVLRQVVGASIFWDTPIGPLRFNWSDVLEKQPDDVAQKFELTISTEF